MEAHKNKPEPQTNLSDVFRIMRRRIVIILFTVGVGFFVGLFVVQSKEPMYESKSSVELKEEVTFKELFTRYSSARGKIATESTIMTSFPVLALVGKKLGDIPEGLTEDEIVSDPQFQAIVRTLQGSVTAAPRENTNIIDITAVAPTPARARDLAQAVAEEYRNYHRITSEQRADEAGWFVKEQREVLVDSLNRVERELIEFKERNNILDLPSEAQRYVEQFSGLMDKRRGLERLMGDMDLFLDRLAVPEGAGSEFAPFAVEEVGAAFITLFEDYSKIVVQEKNLEVGLTPEHPEMKDVQRRRESLAGDLMRQGRESRARWERHLNEVYKEIVELDQKHKTALHQQIELGRMNRELDIVQNILGSLEEKYQELRLQNSIRGDNVRIVQPAILPSDPFIRKSWGALIAVVFLGLVLGVGLAFVQESLDFSLVTIEEVEHYLGLPVLGVIPHFDVLDAERELPSAVVESTREMGQELLRLYSHVLPKSVVAESYRALKMHLWKGGEGGKVFGVTSAMPQEGKSNTLMNLALCFSQSGLKTLLIEGNTRRPVYKNVLKFTPKPGLVELVHGTATVQDAIRDVTDLMLSEFSLDFLKLTPGFENLYILPAGETPLNPPDVLSSFARGDLLARFRQEYDVVLVDSPPILPVSDATIIAPATDGIMLVYRWGKTGRQLVRRAVEAIEKVGGKVLGVVLNDVDFRIGGMYPAYRYRLGRGTYTYGHPPKKETGAEVLTHAWRKMKDRVQAVKDRLQLRS